MRVQTVDLVQHEHFHDADRNRKHPHSLFQKMVDEEDFQKTVAEEVDHAEDLRSDLQMRGKGEKCTRKCVVGITGQFMLGEENDERTQTLGAEEEQNETAEKLEAPVDAFNDHTDLEEPMQETSFAEGLIHE